MAHIKLGGAVLLALGLCFSCQKTESPPQTTDTTAGTAGSAQGGSGGSGGSASGSGGDGNGEVRRGERGSSCDSTADCADDLTCIVTHDCPAGVACANKSCQPSNFNLTGTGKSCHISECTTKNDCCGDKPQQAPAKCAARDATCTGPNFPGCIATTCVLGSTTCGEGKCSNRCSYDGKACDVNADCENKCDPITHVCSATLTDCTTTPCATIASSCTLSPICICANPDYDPSDAICTDPDCEDICGFTCKEDRCVVDDSCAGDEECPATAKFCVNAACVQCKKDADCEDEKCVNNHCGPKCKADTQCALFEACQSGECVHVGCRSDRECVLQAPTQNAAPSQDPRLAKCSIVNKIGTCVMPCEIDAQCAPTEVCLDKVCKYIGCETDAECKTIAGLHDLPVATPERPWVTTAVCKPEDAATP